MKKKLMMDKSVMNRLYVTKKGRTVECNGFTTATDNEQYLQCRDTLTDVVSLYAKRDLRSSGYVRRETAMSQLAVLL